MLFWLMARGLSIRSTDTREMNEGYRLKEHSSKSRRLFTFNHFDEIFSIFYYWIPRMTSSQINMFATSFHINNNKSNNSSRKRQHSVVVFTSFSTGSRCRKKPTSKAQNCKLNRNTITRLKMRNVWFEFFFFFFLNGKQNMKATLLFYLF